MSPVTIWACPNRDTAVSQKRPGLLSAPNFLTDRDRRDRTLDEPDLSGGVDPVVAGLVGKEPPQHLVGRPLHRRDRVDAETLVDERAAGVVDAGDDALDAVRLACDPGAQDVRVVAVRHGREGPGLVDPGIGEMVPVEAEAHDRAAAEAGGQPPERASILVDH